MSIRRIIFLFVALVASASTIVLGRMWLKAERASMVVEKPAEKPATAVLVAKGSLPAGHFVRPENLRWQPWPEGAVAPSYVVTGKRRLEDYVGAVVRIGLSDGEPITDTRVVRPGDRGFLAAVLTPGYRAITVNVSPSSGIAGFVFPGDRIDLVGSFKVEWEAQNGVTHLPHYASETVLTDVRVLAVDQRSDDQSKDVVVAKTATLEVTPKQAEIIAVVSELGKFSLSLRSLAQNDEGTQVESSKPYTWDSEAARMIAPPPSLAGGNRTVTIFHGADAKDIEFTRSVR